MRSWMIGLVLGLLPVLLLPALPHRAVAWILAFIGLMLPFGRRAPYQFCSGLAVGCALALFHGQLLLDRRLVDNCVGKTLTITGEVASLPRHSAFPDGNSRQRFELSVDAISPPGCAGPRRILLSYYGPAKMTPGDSWQFPVSLSKPWGLANPGSFNLQAWYAQTGIDAVGSVRGGPVIKQAGRAALASLPNRARQEISERIAVLPLAANITAVLAAVTVADKSGVDAALWTLFQQFGINHLLVISGLHVGLVAGVAYLLGRLLQTLLLLGGVFLGWLPALLALIFCCTYTALAGFSVATQRALCMLLCFLLAGLLGRTSSGANNLLLAAVVILAINPLAALGSGFWLSFSAVAALLWLAGWQRGRSAWLRVLWTHVFMSLVMLPLGAWWFGGSSLVAGAANLLMVPLVGLFVVPLALLAVLAMYTLPSLEMPLWRLAAWPLERLLPLAQRVAGDGWFYQPLSPLLPDVFLAALGVTLLALPISRLGRVLAVLLLLPLALPLHNSYILPDAHDGPLPTLVTVLDVGQGTAVIVRSGDRTLVYDTGGGDPVGANMANAVLLPYLRRLGVNALDTLVISHPDNDHSAGASTLLAAMPAAQVYFGGQLSGLVQGRACFAGQAWRWPGGPHFQFLSPARHESMSSNNSSCVLQIDTHGHQLLLAGDVERGQELEMVRYWGGDLASDWLLVAHHGSRTSSSPALLKAVQPGVAIISSGYANRFGHPHPNVVDRLNKMGATIYSTASSGALEFTFAPERPVQLRRWRDEQRRFWM